MSKYDSVGVKLMAALWNATSNPANIIFQVKRPVSGMHFDKPKFGFGLGAGFRSELSQSKCAG